MTSRRPSSPIGGRVQGRARRLRRSTSRGRSSKRSRKSARTVEMRNSGQSASRQGGREQAVEALALVRVGEGEELLELVDGEQEGGVVALAPAQPVRQAAVVRLQRAADIGHLLRLVQGLAGEAGQ